MDEIVSGWTETFDMDALVELLDSAEVPVSPVNSVSDIFQNPQFQARDSVIEVDDPVMGKMKMPGIVPRLSQSPGHVDRLAPALGEHNQEVYSGLLGYSSEEIALLKEERVI